MANQTKYAPEFRRESADYAIASGRPITKCARSLGLNDKTLNDWVIKRRRELAGDPDPKAEARELREAQRRIRELEAENEFLRRYEQNFVSPCLISSFHSVGRCRQW